MNYTILTGKDKELSYKYNWNAFADFEDLLEQIQINARIPNSKASAYRLYDLDWKPVTSLKDFETVKNRTLRLEHAKNRKKPLGEPAKLPSLAASNTNSRLSVKSQMSATNSVSTSSVAKLPLISAHSHKAHSDSEIYTAGSTNYVAKNKRFVKRGKETKSVDRNNNNNMEEKERERLRNETRFGQEKNKKIRRKIARKSKGSPYVDAGKLGDEDGRNEGIVPKSKFVIPINDKMDITRRYEFNEVIGDGNFAVVSVCSDRRDQSLWAIKEIDKRNVKGKMYYVENEVDLLIRCKHPSICRLREAFQSPFAYYLILENLDNGDLFDAIKVNGTFAESVTAGVIYDTANALQYLHHFQIAHRDIKPENLLISRDFRIKIADFGLACKVLGRLKRVCGTPTYVAPEILSEAGYGLEVDVWSLGIIVHIMLVGYAPFRSTKREELFHLIQQGHYTFDMPGWDKVSNGAKDLISEILVVDPRNRATAVQVMRNPWLRKKLGS